MSQSQGGTQGSVILFFPVLLVYHPTDALEPSFFITEDYQSALLNGRTPIINKLSNKAYTVGMKYLGIHFQYF